MKSTLIRRFAGLSILLGCSAFALEGNSPEEMLSDLKTNAWGMPGYAAVEVLTPPASTSESVAAGKQLAEVYCISCHGISLAGEGYDESVSMNPPQSLRDTRNYHFGFMDLGIFRTIKYGVPGVMQSYQEQMTDDQIWALTSYVRSLQKS